MKPPEPGAALVNPSNINFKLRQLALLTALAETGTLKAAAARINVSQPGATRLLRELEDMLGVALFDRVKGRMVVTPAGQTMIGRANALQSEMVSAYRATQDAASGQGASVSLGIFSALSPETLADALKGLQEQLPRVRVSVIEAPQNLLLGALRRYEVDAVVGRLSGTDGHVDLQYDMLYTESFCLVCGAGHPMAAVEGECSIEDLADSPWIMAASGTALRQRIDTYFVTHLGRAPTGSIETRSLLAHLGLLADGRHVGVLPTRLASFLEAQGQLRIVRRDFDGMDGAITFITRPDAPNRKVLDALRHAFEEAVQERAGP